MPLLVQFQRRATLEIAGPSRGRAYLRWKNPQAMPEPTAEGEVCLFPVSRSDGKRGTNYCEDSFDKWHHSCVNKHRKGGVGHYEWRLPEPMGPDHFELLVEFIIRFLDNENRAVEWAENIVREGDDRLTSVKRAKSIGEPFKHDRPVVTPAANLLESLI